MPHTLDPDPDLVHSVSRPFHLRSPAFVAKRRRWPGVLACSAIAAGLAALVFSSQDGSGYAGKPPNAVIADTVLPMQAPATAGIPAADDRADAPVSQRPN